MTNTTPAAGAPIGHIRVRLDAEPQLCPWEYSADDVRAAREDQWAADPTHYEGGVELTLRGTVDHGDVAIPASVIDALKTASPEEKKQRLTQILGRMLTGSLDGGNEIYMEALRNKAVQAWEPSRDGTTAPPCEIDIALYLGGAELAADRIDLRLRGTVAGWNNLGYPGQSQDWEGQAPEDITGEGAFLSAADGLVKLLGGEGLATITAPKR